MDVPDWITPERLTTHTSGLPNYLFPLWSAASRNPGHRTARLFRPRSYQSLAVAGCLRSSARDLAPFAQAILRALHTAQTTLDRAIVRSIDPVLGLGPRGATVPTAHCSGRLLVTMDQKMPGCNFLNGRSGGSSCSLYISPARQTAFGTLPDNGVAGNLRGQQS